MRKHQYTQEWYVVDCSQKLIMTAASVLHFLRPHSSDTTCESHIDHATVSRWLQRDLTLAAIDIAVLGTTVGL